MNQESAEASALGLMDPEQIRLTGESTSSSRSTMELLEISDSDGQENQIDLLPLATIGPETGRRSKVWTFFRMDPECDSKAICQLCDNATSLFCGKGKNSTTTTMTRHIRGKHSQEYAEHFENKDQSAAKKPRFEQSTLQEAFSNKKWNIDDHRSKRLHYAVGEMIAVDIQPYNIVENIGFQRLLKTLQPHYMLPRRTYFTEKIIPDILNRVTVKIRENLDKAKWISLTSDIWTSSTNNNSFISLTAHWIDEKFDYKHAMLNSKSFPGSHTAAAIASILIGMLENWGLDLHRVYLLIRDNAANMSKGAKDANIPSLGCFIHSLQLLILAAINSQPVVKNVITKSKKVVGHFNHSPLANSKLAEEQVRLGLPKKKLIQDVATRWNSQYYMLERMYEQKSVLGALSVSLDFTNLTVNEWNIMGSLLSLLQPFEELTKVLSQDLCFISEVIPMVVSLRKILETTNPAHFGVGTMKSELLSSLNKRFEDCDDVDYYNISTCLDPRYKTAFFQMNEQAIQYIKSNVVSAVMALAECPNVVPTSITARVLPVGLQPFGPPTRQDESHNSLWNVFESFAAQHREESVVITTQEARRTAISTELNTFLSLPIEPMFRKETEISTAPKRTRTNPLEWWKSNFSTYPHLAIAVPKYLSAPASSVYSERLFSEAGLIHDDNRNRLTPEHAESLLFLRHNLRIFDYEY